MTLPAAVRAGAGADIEITVWRGRGVSAACRYTVITTKITVWRGRGVSTARRYTVIKGLLVRRRASAMIVASEVTSIWRRVTSVLA